MERNPIVNGKFYPDEPSDLKAMIQGFNLKSSLKTTARGIVLPHAGFTYSGCVAASTVNKVLPKKRLLILGPNHSGKGAKFSLWPGDSWKILNKNIKIDKELAKAILNKGNNIQENALAHATEHSIEVELPILDYFFNDFKFVPIACQNGTIVEYQKVAKQIFEAINSLKGLKEEILLVASSDFTHYEPDQVARRKDLQAIEAIINLDEEELINRIHKENITLCGEAPLAIFISCLKQLGAKKSQVILYQTSGDVTGDKESVVGYAGIIIQ